MQVIASSPGCHGHSDRVAARTRLTRGRPPSRSLTVTGGQGHVAGVGHQVAVDLTTIGPTAVRPRDRASRS